MDSSATSDAILDNLIVPSPLGPVLLEASPLGLRRVEFLTEEDAARIRAADAGREAVTTSMSILAAAASQVQAYFSGERQSFDLPLDLKGTPFQRQVWRKGLRIPYGEVRPCSWIAEAVGCPGGEEAIAQAFERNPVVIIVPCHRVTGGADILAYSGGEHRKRSLQQLEQAAQASSPGPGK